MHFYWVIALLAINLFASDSGNRAFNLTNGVFFDGQQYFNQQFVTALKIKQVTGKRFVKPNNRPIYPSKNFILLKYNPDGQITEVHNKIDGNKKLKFKYHEHNIKSVHGNINQVPFKLVYEYNEKKIATTIEKQNNSEDKAVYEYVGTKFCKITHWNNEDRVNYTEKLFFNDQQQLVKKETLQSFGHKYTTEEYIYKDDMIFEILKEGELLKRYFFNSDKNLDKILTFKGDEVVETLEVIYENNLPESILIQNEINQDIEIIRLTYTFY